MLPRYSVSPRSPPLLSGRVQQHCRNTQLRPRRPPPRRRGGRKYRSTRGLQKRWSIAVASKFNQISLNTIQQAAKENIKTVITTLLINASPKIQSLLSVALSVIEVQDFYGALPILLPNIVVHLNELSQTEDYESINALLATANSLFTKFRYAFKTIDFLVDLKYCVDNFAKPLLRIFKRTASLIDEVMANNAANDPILKLYIESQTLCCLIFYSLNFQEVPHFFKDHMCEWMVEFKKYLIHKYPALEDYGDDVLDELRASVCENISLYMINDDALFQQDYLSGFVDGVVSLLVSYSLLGRDQLTIPAIKFLITVTKSGHHILLSRSDILQQICQSIVIPNVMLQDEEEKLFYTDPLEFIKRDLEENDDDMNTRRGIACELLKGIAMHYKDIAIEKVRNQIIRCNIECNWKYKDCAVRLVMSLATKNADETSASTDLVNVQNFYVSYVAVALKPWYVVSFPRISACLKFLILFRNQILKKLVLQVLPDLSRLLASPDSVVHSYAAICIEKLLLVKDDGDRARYTSEDIRLILPTMMKNLFWVLNYPDSAENQYVMKCIMRVVLVGDLDPDVATLCIERLTYILNEACVIRKSPLFCQYLFESMIALIRRVCVLSQENKRWPCKKDISFVSIWEKKLYPCLQMILAEDINEYFPYAFRLLAELVDLKRFPLPKNYSKIYDILLLPDTWTRSAIIPSVIAIYSKLAPSLEDHGYHVLNTVIENLGFEVISPFVSSIWVSLFNRLQYKSTVKHVKNILVFMSLLLLKDGLKNLVASVNADQPNAFRALLEQFWIPNLELITGPFESKLISVALTRVICECSDLLDLMLWGKMLDSIMTLLLRHEHASSRIDDEPEIPEFGETIGGYNASTFARKKEEEEEDALKGIKDPRQFLVASLSNLFATSTQGSKYHQVISENLEQANQAALLQLFKFQPPIPSS